MNRDNLLMVADTEHCADMLYAVGMFVPDPFIYLRLRGRAHIIVSDLEFDRAREQAGHCRVLSLSRLQQRLRKDGVKKPGLPHVIRRVLKDHGVKGVFVPPQFPIGLARELTRLKLRVKPAKAAVFPERQIKTPDEVKKISAALIMAEVGLAEAIQALKNCKIGRRRRLIHRGNPLTSEKLRAIIDTAVLQAGGLACHTIVAGGRQACDPHECGYGVLRAHEPIVLDVFPRSQKTGYFGDITRTVVRGRASEALRRLYDTVAQAQQLGLEQLQHGARGGGVHQQVDDYFKRQGYKTGRRGGRMQGFFHGTGHGVGLELHEGPRLGNNSRDTLKAGHVVTVEPGLYYWELGGAVRLEDVALVTRNGARNLTQFEKTLEV
jgi:Xaa-Pro aminopeptidase